MYRFLAILTPDDIEAIAAQLYVECLQHGYTAVAEFHYLHNAPDGSRYADPAELSHRIIAAAQASGIGLTLLPVLYCRSQFGGAAPTDGTAPLHPDAGCLRGAVPVACRQGSPRRRTAFAARRHARRTRCGHRHRAAMRRSISMSPNRKKKSTDCIAWSGARPVAWLLDHAPVDRAGAWCMPRTWMTRNAGGLRQAARSQGCARRRRPTSAMASSRCEHFWRMTDTSASAAISNVCTSPIEELRWLEYVRRLETRARNVTETRQGASVATSLYTRALHGGVQALGRDAGAIAAGKLADLVVLDTEHPTLVGRTGEAGARCLAVLRQQHAGARRHGGRRVGGTGRSAFGAGGDRGQVRRRDATAGGGGLTGFAAALQITHPNPTRLTLPSPPCTPRAAAADETAPTVSAARPTGRTTTAVSRRSRRRPAAAAACRRSRAVRPDSGSGYACAPSGRTTAGSAAARTGRLHSVAELLLDRRIDQDAIHPGSAGGQVQQRHHLRRPDATDRCRAGRHAPCSAVPPSRAPPPSAAASAPCPARHRHPGPADG